MNDLNPLFLIPLTTGPIFILMGLVMLVFPPKKINMLYGYRSRNSMKNQQRWNFAQNYSAKRMMIYGGILSLLAFAGKFIDLSETNGLIAGIGLLFIMAAVLIVDTERAINKKFGKPD